MLYILQLCYIYCKIVKICRKFENKIYIRYIKILINY